MKKKDKSGPKAGDRFPDLSEVKWIKGGKVSLGDQLTAVNIWESELDEASEAVSHIAEVQGRYENLSVLALTSDSKKTALDFIEGQGETFSFSAGLMPEKVKEELSGTMRYTPFSFLVNSEGNILWTGSTFMLGRILELHLDEGRTEEAIRNLSDQIDTIERINDDTLGSVTRHRKMKKEIMEMTEKLLEFFADDPVINDLRNRFSFLIPGEPAPSLDEIEWIEGRPVSEKKLTLIEIWDSGNSTHMVGFPILNKLRKKYKKDQLEILALGIVRDSDEEFLTSQKEYINFPVGRGADSLYDVLRRGELAVTSVIIGSDGTYLWSGSNSNVHTVIGSILDQGNAEASLIDHCVDLEDFMYLKNEFEEKEITRKDYEKIRTLSKKVLAVEPGHYETLLFLFDAARTQGFDELYRLCGELDTSQFNDENYRLLALQLDKDLDGDNINPYEYQVKWAYEALRLAPSNGYHWMRYAEALFQVHLTDQALTAALKALELAEEHLIGSCEELKEKCVKLLAVHKISAGYFN